MSQDIRREREGGFIPWPDVKAAKAAERWKNIAYNENERAGQIQQLLDAANAKLAEANDALDQARREPAPYDVHVARVLDWLDRKEATVAAQIAEATAPQEKDFRDLGAIESRASKLRHAQYDGKLLGELRNLLAPSVWRDDTTRRPATQYWRTTTEGSVEYHRVVDSGRPEYWSNYFAAWRTSHKYDQASDVELHADRQVAAVDLPEGVTP